MSKKAFHYDKIKRALKEMQQIVGECIPGCDPDSLTPPDDKEFERWKSLAPSLRKEHAELVAELTDMANELEMLCSDIEQQVIDIEWNRKNLLKDSGEEEDEEEDEDE